MKKTVQTFEDFVGGQTAQSNEIPIISEACKKMLKECYDAAKKEMKECHDGGKYTAEKWLGEYNSYLDECNEELMQECEGIMPKASKGVQA